MSYYNNKNNKTTHLKSVDVCFLAQFNLTSLFPHCSTYNNSECCHFIVFSLCEDVGQSTFFK